MGGTLRPNDHPTSKIGSWPMDYNVCVGNGAVSKPQDTEQLFGQLLATNIGGNQLNDKLIRWGFVISPRQRFLQTVSRKIV